MESLAAQLDHERSRIDSLEEDTGRIDKRVGELEANEAKRDQQHAENQAALAELKAQAEAKAIEDRKHHRELVALLSQGNAHLERDTEPRPPDATPPIRTFDLTDARKL